MRYIKTPFVDVYTKETKITNGRTNPYKEEMKVLWIKNTNDATIYGTVPDGVSIDVGEELSEDDFEKELKETIKSSGKYQSLKDDIEEHVSSDVRNDFLEELENVKDQDDFKTLKSKVDPYLPDDDEETE